MLILHCIEFCGLIAAAVAGVCLIAGIVVSISLWNIARRDRASLNRWLSPQDAQNLSAFSDQIAR